jgi:hypothetical protein
VARRVPDPAATVSDADLERRCLALYRELGDYRLAHDLPPAAQTVLGALAVVEDEVGRKPSVALAEERALALERLKETGAEPEPRLSHQQVLDMQPELLRRRGG